MIQWTTAHNSGGDAERRHRALRFVVGGSHERRPKSKRRCVVFARSHDQAQQLFLSGVVLGLRGFYALHPETRRPHARCIPMTCLGFQPQVSHSDHAGSYVTGLKTPVYQTYLDDVQGDVPTLSNQPNHRFFFFFFFSGSSCPLPAPSLPSVQCGCTHKLNYGLHTHKKRLSSTSI